ncbi:MAG: SurA N-terminal domain-containing protein [Myxococcaceae bacterium]|nr:SurA N-terminal domain-containing protein [Myxococcaceae bacterium]
MQKSSYDFRKLFSLLFIVGIAVVFTLQFGPGSRGCEAPLVSPENKAGVVATVNGKEIPASEFRRAYRMMLDQYRGQGLSEDLARQLGFHKQVLDQLINTELLAQAAEKHGVTASDEELARLIQNNPGFHKDGKFDLQAYRQTLQQYYRKTDVEFERELRHQLSAQKMLDMVDASAAVSEDEIRSRFLKEGNKAQITFVRFAPTQFADKVPAPTPEELKAYKDAHQKEIADYYNANKFLYSQPEQLHVRRILIKVPENATDAQKEEAKKKIDNLRKQIVDEKKDFAEVAKASSEDPGSRAQGGDLGFNTADVWPKPFADAAAGLKEGEVSQPVLTQYGWDLIKLEEKKPPMNKPLEAVSDEIATTFWKKEKAKELAKQAAEQALADAKAGKDWKTLFPPPPEGAPKPSSFTAPTQPVAVETEEFNAAAQAIPRLGPSPQLLPEVFARKEPGLLDRVFEQNDAFVVATVTSRKEPSEADFAKQKDQLTSDARRAKQYELRDAFIKSLKAAGDIKTNEAVIDEIVGPAQPS